MDKEKQEVEIVETPLILDFFEDAKGATGNSTSGTWDDVDGGDSD